MNQNRQLEDFRRAAEQAIQAQDALLATWRAIDQSVFLHLASPSDVQTLHELIVRRIYPVNAFGALVRLSVKDAVEVLLSRYVGKAVDPDSKFGGYRFELSAMLEDLFEVSGEESLRCVIRHPEFNPACLNDQRFVDSVCDALSLDDLGEFRAWLAKSHEDHPE